jgi:hypothetical protein
VGAGLPAKAVDQPIFPLTDTAHSRASPLPHFAQRFTQVNVPVLLRKSPNNCLALVNDALPGWMALLAGGDVISLRMPDSIRA